MNGKHLTIMSIANNNSLEPIDITSDKSYAFIIIPFNVWQENIRQKFSQATRLSQTSRIASYVPCTESVSLLHKFGFTSLAVVKTALMLMVMFLLLGNGFFALHTYEIILEETRVFSPSRMFSLKYHQRDTSRYIALSTARVSEPYKCSLNYLYYKILKIKVFCLIAKKKQFQLVKYTVLDTFIFSLVKNHNSDSKRYSLQRSLPV